MSDYDDLTRPNKRKPKLPGNSKDLLQQMENSNLDQGKFTKKFADTVLGPQKGGLSVEGGSKGPLASKMGSANIQSADFMGNVKWTPAKKIITFLLTGGSYAGFIIALYLSGAKELAIIVGAAVMLVFLITYILYWIVKG